MSELPAAGHEPWDAEREFPRDRRAERKLILKELGVIGVLLALLSLRILIAR